MVREIEPKEASRAMAFELWMKAPNPMVKLMKTMDITHLVRAGKRRSLRFNTLLDYCVGKAASDIREFYTLLVGDKLMRYDTLAVCHIVKNRKGGVSSCDVLAHLELKDFNREYLEYTALVAEQCENSDLADSMVIGTSAVTETELKMKDAIDPDEVLQAAKYCPYLEIMFGPGYEIVPVLVLTAARELFEFVPIGKSDAVLPVRSGDMLFNAFNEYLGFLN